jgi:hypothetical protein
MTRPAKKPAVKRRKVPAEAAGPRSEESGMPKDVFIVQRGDEYKVKPPTAIVHAKSVRFGNLTDRDLRLFFPKGFASPTLEIAANGSGEIAVSAGDGEYAYAVFVNLDPRGSRGEFATGESSPRVIIDGDG